MIAVPLSRDVNIIIWRSIKVSVPEDKIMLYIDGETFVRRAVGPPIRRKKELAMKEVAMASTC